MPRCERGGAGSKPAGHPISGRGVVVAHLPWEQVYAGSNPAAQTMGGDLGSGWSPKPASEVQSLGRPQSPQSGPARVSGGEPSPGPARSFVEVAKTERPPAATRCTRGFDSRPRLSRFRAQGVPGCTPACQFGGAGSTPAGRSQRTRGRSARGTGLPSRRGGFDSRRVLKPVVLQGGCWHPSRPHKPGPVGSIPTPATGKRPHGVALVNGASQEANVSTSTGLHSRQLSEWDEDNTLSSNT